MEFNADYHTHTIYSHGSGSIEDNVIAARKLGFEKIAICDHGPGHKFYGVRREDFKKMREEIDFLNNKYKDIDILLGVEANVLSYNGDIDVDDELLEIIDILLLGYHYGIIPKNISSAFKFYVINFFSKRFNIFTDYIVNQNTQALIKAINRYPVKIITHPGSKARIDAYKLGMECAKKDVFLEINSHHSHLSVDSLKEALKTDVTFVVDSDAHSPERVGEYSKAIDRIKKAELDSDRIFNIR